MRFIAIALLALSLLFIFPGLEDRDFWPPDESRYGGVAREMHKSGDFAVPHLNDEIYGEKPPGYFWAVQGAAWVTGQVDEESTRLPAALGAVILVLLCGWASAKDTGAHAGFLSGMVLLATHSFAWQARYAQLDLLFAAFVSLAALSGFRALEESRPRSLILSFLWLGLAMLVKGPLALLVLPLLLFWRLLGRPEKREGTSFKKACMLGLALMLLPGIAWLVWAGETHGWGYVRDDLFQRNIIERAQKGLAHRQNWHFYLRRLPLALAPWLLFLPVFLSKNVRDLLGKKGRRLCGFSALWVILFFTVQSVFPGKRSVYTFIFYAPIAILIGNGAAAAVSSKSTLLLRSWSGLIMAAVALACLALGGVLMFTFFRPENFEWIQNAASDLVHKDVPLLWSDLRLPTTESPAYARFVGHMRLLALPLIGAGLGTLFMMVRRRLDSGLDVLLLGLAAAIGVALAVGAPWLNESRSRRVLAQSVKQIVNDSPLAIFRHTDEGLLFYLDQHLPELTGDPPRFDENATREQRLAQLNGAAESEASSWLIAGGVSYLLIRRSDRERLVDLEEDKDYKVVQSRRVGSRRWYDLIRSTQGVPK